MDKKMNLKEKIKKIKFNKKIILYLLLIAIITTVVRVNLDSGANYYNEKNNGVLAKVAKFKYNVKNSTQNIEINLNENNETNFEIEIDNKNDNSICEVGMSYSVVLTFSDKIMELLNDGTLLVKDIYINDVSKNVTPTINNSKKTYTYDDLGVFEAGIYKNDKCKVVFKASDDVVKIEEEDINIKVKFEQSL